MYARHLLALVAAAFLGVGLLAAPAVSSQSADVATGTIEGTATIDPDGPFEGMRVSARPFAGGEVVASGLSDAEGRFTLTVPPGEYLVTLHSTEFRYPIEHPYRPFRFDHYSKGPDNWSTDRIEEARPVTVAAGQKVTGIGLISWFGLGFDGYLIAREPSLLRGLMVRLYERDGTLAATYTVRSKDIQGRQAVYTMSGLRQGTYRIGLRKGGIVDEPDAGTFKVEVTETQAAREIRVRRYTVNTSRPRISTPPRVGRPLTASVGGWTRTEGVGWRYRWYANGKPIKAATRARYTPTAGMLGKRLTVRVSAVNRGQVLERVRSIATGKVAHGRIQVVRRPSLTVPVAPVVGRYIGRDLGRWKPGGLTWRHQWLRNGKAIPGERGRTYRLRSADRGKKVSLRVTAARKGYRDKVQRTDVVVVRRAR